MCSKCLRCLAPPTTQACGRAPTKMPGFLQPGKVMEPLSTFTLPIVLPLLTPLQNVQGSLSWGSPPPHPPSNAACGSFASNLNFPLLSISGLREPQKHLRESLPLPIWKLETTTLPSLSPASQSSLTRCLTQSPFTLLEVVRQLDRWSTYNLRNTSGIETHIPVVSPYKGTSKQFLQVRIPDVLKY